MQEPLQHNSIEVFVGIDVGKGQHHAAALDRSGRRLYNKALPNDEAKLRALINELTTLAVQLRRRSGRPSHSNQQPHSRPAYPDPSRPRTSAGAAPGPSRCARSA